MATPVITASSSILGFKRNESFEFQPAATNMSSPGSPAWSAVGLPSGVSIDGDTGLISGSASVAGVYVVTVSATNADPATGTREFVIGISSEAAVAAASSDTACEWVFDLATRAISLYAQEPDADPQNALAHWKKDDVFILRLRFSKNGTHIDPDPSSIKLALKEYDPDPYIVLGSTFARSSETGASAYFDLLVDLTGSRVAAALGNYDSDAGATFQAIVELQMESEVVFGAGTQAIRLSSRNGSVNITRDLVD